MFGNVSFSARMIAVAVAGNGSSASASSTNDKTPSRIAERADERFELGYCARQSVRAHLEDAEIIGRPLVGRRELAPTLPGRQSLLRQLELVGDASRTLGRSRLVGEHGRGEKLARGGLQVLALERDVAEQQVRVHVDLGVGAIDRGCARTRGDEHDR